MSRTHAHPERSVLLADLRRRVARFEPAAVSDGGHFRLGVPALERHLPGGGLSRAGVHEIVAGRAGDGAGLAFSAFLAARRALDEGGDAGGMVLWCVAGRGLYGPGLAALGLAPERLLLALGRDDSERLWVMEEALRCRGLTAVVAEIRHLDLKQSRRLQLAAEASGVTGLLYRPWGADLAAGAALTRWRISSLPSLAGMERHGRSVGQPGLQAELMRVRAGRAAHWHLCWRDGALAEADRRAENAWRETAASSPAAAPAASLWRAQQ
jgi:protein ImuA